MCLAIIAALSLTPASRSGDICELPPDVGPCDGLCPRWYFNPASGQCETFVWGCCEGNENNFETLAECEKACGGCAADVTGDGAVDVQDLVAVVSAWSTGRGPADINGDGIVDVQDLIAVITAWGSCS